MATYSDNQKIYLNGLENETDRMIFESGRVIEDIRSATISVMKTIDESETLIADSKNSMRNADRTISGRSLSG